MLFISLLTFIYLYKYLPVMFFLMQIRKGGIIGIPKTVYENWMPQTGTTCAIASQRIILRIFSINKDLSDLAERQAAYGHYKEGLGSNSLSFLLDGYGIKTKQSYINEKLFEYGLWKSLKQNKILIVAVNSYLLNNPDEFSVNSKEANPNHAILITGIERKNGEYIVYYSDVGISNGRLKKVKSNYLLQAISKKYYSMTETPSVPNESISHLDKKNNFSKDTSQKFTIICPSCEQKLRVPKKNIIVTCKRCSNKFKYPA